MTCVGTYYADRSDIELFYGKDNTAKWADVDNTDVVLDIDDRICWALKSAAEYINNRLASGPYVIPFVTPYSQALIDNTARYAGVLLYEARGTEDVASTPGKLPMHQLSYQRTLVERWIDDLLTGRVMLSGLAHTVSFPDTFPSAGAP